MITTLDVKSEFSVVFCLLQIIQPYCCAFVPTCHGRLQHADCCRTGRGGGGCTPRVPPTQISFLNTNNPHADLQRDCSLLPTDRQCDTLLRHQL